MHVAHRSASNFGNGAAFVDLTRIDDELGVARIIAMTLGLKQEQNQSWQEQLPVHLKSQNVLLVLDNFEHVHRAAPWLASFVESCAALTVLCTSRVPLLVHGEYVYDIAPLTLRQASDSTLPSEAAQLFLRGVRGSRDTPTPSNACLSKVEDVCKQLDGLPLAIELAAARAGVIGVERLHQEIRADHGRLKNPMQDAPKRHASLQQLLASICDALDDRARLALRLAAHFEAGFTVQQFAMSGLLTRNESDDVLAQLAASRIVSLDSSPSDGRHDPSLRFRLLETIRTYVRHSDWKDTTAEIDVARAYIRAMHRVTQEIYNSAYTPHERDMYDIFEREFENISSAVRMATEIATCEAREILVFLWRASVERGHVSNWISWADNGLIVAEGAHTADQVNLLTAASEVYRIAMQFPLAVRFGEIAVQKIDVICMVSGVDASAAHRALARAYGVKGELDHCAKHATEALRLALAENDEIGELEAVMLKTSVDVYRNRFRDAAASASVARDICRTRSIELPRTLVTLSAISQSCLGDLIGASDLYASLARRCNDEGNDQGELDALVSQAETEIFALRLDRAREILRRARDLMGNSQCVLLEYDFHKQLGAMNVMQNDPDQARAALEIAITSTPDGALAAETDVTLLWFVHAHMLAGDFSEAITTAIKLTSDEVSVQRMTVPFAIETLATLFSVMDDARDATILLNAAQRLRMKDGLSASPAEKLLSEESRRKMVKGLRTNHFEEPEDIFSYANSTLRKLSTQRPVDFVQQAAQPRARLVNK
jgi:predicted ATPase